METISKKNILEKLHALKPDLVVKYKVKGLELFGSVAREESHPNSDIDLLVQFAEDADMFDLVGLSSFWKRGYIARWMWCRSGHCGRSFNLLFYPKQSPYEGLSPVSGGYYCRD